MLYIPVFVTLGGKRICLRRIIILSHCLKSSKSSQSQLYEVFSTPVQYLYVHRIFSVTQHVVLPNPEGGPEVTPRSRKSHNNIRGPQAPTFFWGGMYVKKAISILFLYFFPLRNFSKMSGFFSNPSATIFPLFLLADFITFLLLLGETWAVPIFPHSPPFFHTGSLFHSCPYTQLQDQETKNLLRAAGQIGLIPRGEGFFGREV